MSTWLVLILAAGAAAAGTLVSVLLNRAATRKLEEDRNRLLVERDRGLEQLKALETERDTLRDEWAKMDKRHTPLEQLIASDPRIQKRFEELKSALQRLGSEKRDLVERNHALQTQFIQLGESFNARIASALQHPIATLRHHIDTLNREIDAAVERYYLAVEKFDTDVVPESRRLTHMDGDSGTSHPRENAAGAPDVGESPKSAAHEVLPGPMAAN